MKKLRPGETPDIIGQSREFNLKDIGKGSVKLGDLYFNLDINGNILSIPKDECELEPAKKYFRQSLGLVVVDIHSFLPHLETQPNIRCIVNAGKIELAANNLNYREGLKENALFYRFALLGRSKAQDLLVPPKLSFLKDLFFRFEPK